MIPIKLSVEAFGPFKDIQNIDFTQFENDRLFLICGKTGSGKTTIFDAISYALFGKASGSSRDSEYFKSQYSSEDTVCYAEFTFVIRGKQYTVRREPMQEKLRRGGNITKENAKAFLTMDDETVISGTSAVDLKIEELLCINADQFRKIVMLPQGEFRKFLSDDPSKKQEILRRIFDTDIYNTFTENLRIKSTQLKGVIDEHFTKIEAYKNSLNIAYCDFNVSDLDFANESNNAFDLLKNEIQKEKEYLDNTQHALDKNKTETDKLNLPYALEVNKQIELLYKSKKEKAALLEQNEYYLKLECKIKKLNSVKELLLLKKSCNSYQLTVEQINKELTDNEKAYNDLLKKQIEVKKIYEKASIDYATRTKLAESISFLKSDEQTYSLISSEDLQKNDLMKKISSLDELILKLNSYYNLSLLKEKKDALLQLYKLTLKKEADIIDYKSADKNYREAFNLFMDSAAYTLSINLKSGLPCPVCGSLEHPAKILKPERFITQQELDEKKKIFTDSEAALRLTAEQINLKSTELSFENPEINSLKIELDKINNTLKLTNENEILSSKEYAEKINAAKSDINAVSNRISEIEINVERLKSNLKTNVKLEDIQMSIKTLTKENEQIELQYKKNSDNLNKINADISIMQQSKKGLLEQRDKSQDSLVQYTAMFNKAMHESNISMIEIEELSNEFNNIEAFSASLDEYKNKLENLNGIIDRLSDKLKDQTSFDIDNMKLQINTLNDEKNTLSQKLHEISVIYENNKNIYSLITSEKEKCGKLLSEYSEVQYLYDTANGKYSDKVNFERYVLAEYFESVINRANIRLEILSDSRYTLERMESREKGNKASGLSLQIFDTHTGKTRHVNTLSGGESFIVSLALALGLADKISEISGGVELNTMFIDEGFGSLDSQSIDYAIKCLDSLKSSGRYIGIISHVAELKEKISQKIIVEAATIGSRIIQNECESYETQ